MVLVIRLWGKIIKNHHIVKHAEVVCNEEIEYQQQLKKCMTELCYGFDIQRPYWLPKNLKDYNARKKTTFKQDNFIEKIDFDYLEIEVMEEK